MAKSIEQLQQEVAKQRKIIADQARELKVREATAPKNAKPTVTIDGVPYLLRAGERTRRGETSRADLAKDMARLRELRDSGSGLLEKIKI